MENLKEITGLRTPPDYRLKTYEERVKWAEELIELSIDEYELGLRKIPTDKRVLGKQDVPRYLDRLGTYVLSATDIASPRKLDSYPFYIDNRAYARSAMEKNTIHIDLTAKENELLHKDFVTDPTYTNYDSSDLFRLEQAVDVIMEDYENTTTQMRSLVKQAFYYLHKKNISKKEFADFTQKVEGELEIQSALKTMLRKIDMDKLTCHQKRMLLKNVVGEKDNNKSRIQESMAHIYESIIANLAKEEDEEYIHLMMEDLTDEEIAARVGLSRSAVSDKLRRILTSIRN